MIAIILASLWILALIYVEIANRLDEKRKTK